MRNKRSAQTPLEPLAHQTFDWQYIYLIN